MQYVRSQWWFYSEPGLPWALYTVHLAWDLEVLMGEVNLPPTSEQGCGAGRGKRELETTQARLRV